MPVKSWTSLSAKVEGYGSLTNNPSSTSFFNEGQMATINHTAHDSYPTFRTGGPWWLSKTDVFVTPASVIKKNGAGTATLYEGTACPPHFGIVPGRSNLVSDNDLDAKGATAMSRVLPTSPHVSLATAMAELRRDGLPGLPGVRSWKDQTFRAKQAGSEYLNVEFGWRPLVSDVMKTAKAVKSEREILDRFENGSGRRIHRRYDYPATTTTSVNNGNGFGYPAQSSIAWVGSTVIRSTTEEWFEGVFEYHLPGGSDYLSRLQKWEAQANHLYGTRPTPDVMWNASPWTWAADWFANGGDVIKNASALAFDGLTLHYGYMMTSTVRDIRTDATCTINGKTYAATLRTVHSVKQRRNANPYGFGLSGLATSLRQKAIVAAIAASRDGRRAR